MFFIFIIGFIIMTKLSEVYPKNWNVSIGVKMRNITVERGHDAEAKIQ